MDCYLEHAMQALRESFEEYENDIEKWLSDEYPLPVKKRISRLFPLLRNLTTLLPKEDLPKDSTFY